MLSFGFHRSPLLCAFERLCILCILFELCLYLWPIACFCKNLMLNISFGCCRHSVSNTFVQLTEGRSARDQPKQPPAKKKQNSDSATRLCFKTYTPVKLEFSTIQDQTTPYVSFIHLNSKEHAKSLNSIFPLMLSKLPKVLV